MFFPVKNRFRYIGLLLAGGCFLFIQSLADLSLPSLMSSIVNIGIVQSGVTDQTPEIIPADAANILMMFMPSQDRTEFQAVYVPFQSLPKKRQVKISAKFPNAAEQQTLVLLPAAAQTERVPAKQQTAKINTVYRRSCYALTNAISSISPAFSENRNHTDKSRQPSPAVVTDIAELKSILPQLPETTVSEAVRKAEMVPELSTAATAAQWNYSFYQKLGADLGWFSISYIFRIGGLMLFLGMSAMACAVGTAFFYSRMGAGIAADLRSAAMCKIMSFTNAEINRFTASALLTRITSDTTNVQNFFANDLRNIFYAPVLAVGGLLLSYHAAPSLSWVIYPIFGLLSLLIVTMLFFMNPRFKLSPKLIDRMNQVSRENLNGAAVIRAFGTEAFHSSRFREANAALTQNTLILTRVPTILLSVLMLLMNFFTVGIVWLGAEKIADSQLQIGNLLAFVQYVFLIILAFSMLTLCLINLPAVIASVVRLAELLETVPFIQDPVLPKTLLGQPVKGEICFENVCFRYQGADENTLHHISFTARPGQTTAIIGATGSGKTTLVNLLLRFYDPTNGTISFDGTDIRQLRQSELRGNIGYVPQQAKLFSGTIEENLRWGKFDADFTVLHRAAEVAQILDFIEQQPDRFQSPVAQGGNNFSGGQRQRLAIARALISQTPVYVFDDSFSALDYLTDARLRKELAVYAQNSTVFIIAQRISTIRYAEQIIVLDNGRIAGCGTHSELLQKCPEYGEIAASQNLLSSGTAAE
jgi:ATP-binding cassette subfamily B protein